MGWASDPEKKVRGEEGVGRGHISGVSSRSLVLPLESSLQPYLNRSSRVCLSPKPKDGHSQNIKPRIPANAQKQCSWEEIFWQPKASLGSSLQPHQVALEAFLCSWPKSFSHPQTPTPTWTKQVSRERSFGSLNILLAPPLHSDSKWSSRSAPPAIKVAW